MDNTYKILKKPEAIEYIKKYIFGIGYASTNKEPFDFCYILFSDGYLHCYYGLYNDHPDYFDARAKRDNKVMNYLLNIHGIEDVRFFILSTDNIHVMFNETGYELKTIEYDSVYQFVKNYKHTMEELPYFDIYEYATRDLLVEKTDNIKVNGNIELKDIPDNIRYYFQFDEGLITDLYGSDILIAFTDGEYFFDYSDFYYDLENLWDVINKHGFENLLCFCIQNNVVNIYYNNSGIEFKGEFIDEYISKVKPKYNISCKPFCDFINKYVYYLSAEEDKKTKTPIISGW